MMMISSLKADGASNVDLRTDSTEEPDMVAECTKTVPDLSLLKSMLDSTRNIRMAAMRSKDTTHSVEIKRWPALIIPEMVSQ